jgi:hypothetical protein
LDAIYVAAWLIRLPEGKMLEFTKDIPPEHSLPAGGRDLLGSDDNTLIVLLVGLISM